MKRNTLILFASLFLLVLGYFVFVHEWNGPDNVFHIDDAKLVGKIELQRFDLGKEGNQILLERGLENEWKLNGKYIANSSKVRDLLMTLQQIRVLKPVEPKGQASALSLLKRNHTEVKIYDREGHVMKNYLIGATNSEQTANIFKMGFSDKCYLVSKPALDGYVSIFYTTELNIWRENLLFDVNGNDLTRISVQYGDSIPGYDLQATHTGWTLGEGHFADQERVKNYLSLFDGKVFAESFAGKAYPQILDSLKRRQPDARLALESPEMKVELALFARPENQNNFFGYLIGTEELLTVQHFVIDKFLKSRDFFISQPL